MNNHRLYRKSKKIQGKGYFLNTPDKPSNVDAIRDKLKKLFSKKMKGEGLKIIHK